MDVVMILALMAIAIVGAGGMWIAWQDGYDKGLADANRDATARRVRALSDGPSWEDRVNADLIGPRDPNVR